MLPVISLVSMNDEEGIRVFPDKPIIEGEQINYLTSDGGIELMQFTGLTDKNGKEIWEGDIITSLGTIFRVDYDVDGFYAVNNDEYASLSSYGLSSNVYDIDDVIVLGNIHENPDLIPKI